MIGWTKGLAVAGMMWGVMALGQGDPARAFDKATAAGRPAGVKMRIDLIGDSTQTDNAGYGRGFCANFTSEVDCVNLAKGGASTRTFREQGLWERGLETKPDYMVIQFGHNDMETKEHLPRQVPMAEYEANLRRYVEEARAAGIKPILCTPLTRRYFEADGKVHSDLLAHAATMKRVAAEMKVPVIDLQAESIAYLDRVGEKEGSTLAITKKDPDGKTIFDKTHLDWKGSYVFGRMVAVGVGHAAPEMAKYVRARAVELPAAGVKAMAILNGAPVKIVLVGDSTVALGGGWGPGFCGVMTPNVTCIDDAKNGRSSKSFMDEGLWTKALAEKGDYYFIQFGHNDMKGKGPKLETDPETTFAANLRKYIADTRAIGAVPVLVTSLSRRTMKDGKVVEDLKDYSEATREVGAKEFVTVVDLNAISTAMLNKMTQEEADKYNATDQAKERLAVGKSVVDRTHLNPMAQKVFGRIVADQMVRTLVELGPDVKGEPAIASAPAAMSVTWRFDRLNEVGGHPTEVLGHPTVIDTPMGKAVQFNGVDDALFVKVHPLAGAETWTWELIFRPDADGKPEQRVFHLQAIDPATGQDVADERMLTEIRIKDGQWCLDSFATAGGQSRALLNCDKKYPFGPWYRVTAVYDGKTLKNYVNDELQGEGELHVRPQLPGRSSMGVRINLRDYYKGAFYAARFTRSALGVGEFMKIPAAGK